MLALSSFIPDLGVGNQLGKTLSESETSHLRQFHLNFFDRFRELELTLQFPDKSNQATFAPGNASSGLPSTASLRQPLA